PARISSKNCHGCRRDFIFLRMRGYQRRSIGDQQDPVKRPKNDSRELWQKQLFQPIVVRLSFFTTRAQGISAAHPHRRDVRARELHVLARPVHRAFAHVGAVPLDRALLVGAPVDVDVAAPALGGVEAAESQSPVFQPVRYPRGAVLEGSPSRYAARRTRTRIGDLDRPSIKFSSGHGWGLNEGLDAFPPSVRCSRVSVPMQSLFPGGRRMPGVGSPAPTKGGCR
ncbi:MAG: hypothetical protein JXA73_14820, partial [Acidobacteria bacterium]|nr:hypothetical protein [Acidobacteriota bacterium]